MLTAKWYLKFNIFRFDWVRTEPREGRRRSITGQENPKYFGVAHELVAPPQRKKKPKKKKEPSAHSIIWPTGICQMIEWEYQSLLVYHHNRYLSRCPHYVVPSCCDSGKWAGGKAQKSDHNPIDEERVDLICSNNWLLWHTQQFARLHILNPQNNHRSKSSIRTILEAVDEFVIPIHSKQQLWFDFNFSCSTRSMLGWALTLWLHTNIKAGTHIPDKLNPSVPRASTISVCMHHSTLYIYMSL